MPVSGSLSISSSILATTSASPVVSTFRLKLHSLHPLQEVQAGAGLVPSSSASQKPMVGPDLVDKRKVWTGRVGEATLSEASSTS